MAANNSYSSTNSSNEDMSLHLGGLFISDNSSNIRSNSRRKRRNMLKNNQHDFTQTWHLGPQFSSQSSNSSRALNTSQRSSGSRGNSYDNLHQKLLKRNHHLQNEPRSFGPKTFAKTCHPILLVSSSDSDNSPNSSTDHDLNLEQGIQPILYHSSPSNSMQELPPLHFSSSSNESLDRTPSYYDY